MRADHRPGGCGISYADQHRAGLDRNGGAYCGPASLHDVLHYRAHEKNAPVGWLTTKGKNLDPKDQADHNVTTNSIWRIGVDAKYDGNTRMSNLRKKLARSRARWSTAVTRPTTRLVEGCNWFEMAPPVG